MPLSKNSLIENQFVAHANHGEIASIEKLSKQYPEIYQNAAPRILSEAVQHNHLAVIANILPYVSDEDLKLTIIYAISNNRDANVIFSLLEAQDFLKISDINLYLWYSAASKALSVVKYLLIKGANPNFTNYSFTPLERAEESGERDEIKKILISCGAAVSPSSIVSGASNSVGVATVSH